MNNTCRSEATRHALEMVLHAVDNAFYVAESVTDGAPDYCAIAAHISRAIGREAARRQSENGKPCRHNTKESRQDGKTNTAR